MSKSATNVSFGSFLSKLLCSFCLGLNFIQIIWPFSNFTPNLLFFVSRSLFCTHYFAEAICFFLCVFPKSNCTNLLSKFRGTFLSKFFDCFCLGLCFIQKNWATFVWHCFCPERVVLKFDQVPRQLYFNVNKTVRITEIDFVVVLNLSS